MILRADALFLASVSSDVLFFMINVRVYKFALVLRRKSPFVRVQFHLLYFLQVETTSTSITSARAVFHLIYMRAPGFMFVLEYVKHKAGGKKVSCL